MLIVSVAPLWVLLLAPRRTRRECASACVRAARCGEERAEARRVACPASSVNREQHGLRTLKRRI
eukprot:5192000-Prymnesium_polylepis.1